MPLDIQIYDLYDDADIPGKPEEKTCPGVDGRPKGKETEAVRDFGVQTMTQVDEGLKHSDDLTGAQAETIGGDRSEKLNTADLQNTAEKNTDGRLASDADPALKSATKCHPPQRSKGEESDSDDNKESVWYKSVVIQVALTVFHAYFRFCPPILLTRWGVDASLTISELILALAKDIVRCQSQAEEDIRQGNEVTEILKPVNESLIEGEEEMAQEDQLSPTKSVSISESNDTMESEPEDHQEILGMEESAVSEDVVVDTQTLTPRKLRPRKTRNGNSTNSSSMLSVLLMNLVNGTKLVYSGILIIFVIPFMSIQVLFQSYLSNFINSLAGLATTDEKEKQDQEFLYFHLLGKPPREQDTSKMRPLATHEWLSDKVLDKAAGQLMKFPLITSLFRRVGVKRPITLFERLAKTGNKYMGSKDQLAPYLKEDPSYDESKDADYEPVDESSDESLEHSEGEDVALEPEELNNGLSDNDAYASGTQRENGNEREGNAAIDDKQENCGEAVPVTSSSLSSGSVQSGGEASNGNETQGDVAATCSKDISVGASDIRTGLESCIVNYVDCIIDDAMASSETGTDINADTHSSLEEAGSSVCVPQSSDKNIRKAKDTGSCNEDRNQIETLGGEIKDKDTSNAEVREDEKASSAEIREKETSSRDVIEDKETPSAEINEDKEISGTEDKEEKVSNAVIKEDEKVSNAEIKEGQEKSGAEIKEDKEVSNAEIKEDKELSNAEIKEKEVSNAEIKEKEVSNAAIKEDKEVSNAEIKEDKEVSNAEIKEKETSGDEVKEKEIST